MNTFKYMADRLRSKSYAEIQRIAEVSGLHFNTVYQIKRGQVEDALFSTITKICEAMDTIENEVKS